MISREELYNQNRQKHFPREALPILIIYMLTRSLFPIPYSLFPVTLFPFP